MTLEISFAKTILDRKVYGPTWQNSVNDKLQFADGIRDSADKFLVVENPRENRHQPLALEFCKCDRTVSLRKTQCYETLNICTRRSPVWGGMRLCSAARGSWKVVAGAACGGRCKFLRDHSTLAVPGRAERKVARTLPKSQSISEDVSCPRLWKGLGEDMNNVRELPLTSASQHSSNLIFSPIRHRLPGTRWEEDQIFFVNDGFNFLENSVVDPEHTSQNEHRHLVTFFQKNTKIEMKETWSQNKG